MFIGPAGCQRGGPPASAPETPVIPVSKPRQAQVIDYVEYTGRTNAVKPVVIQPRVTGYLVEMPFREGAYVRQGQVLFVIDPRPYEAQLEVAKGQLALQHASLDYATATNERFKALAKKSPGAVSERELDQYKALQEQAVANLDVAKANLISAELNLEWTRVTSPIDGYVSRYYLTEGNLVNQDQTQLTSVVSGNPIYVYFDMDEATLLRLQMAINEGAVAPVQVGRAPVEMALQGEKGYQHRGRLNFIDNQVNPSTGSISVRGEFDNPTPVSGNLSPAMAASSGIGLVNGGMAPGPLVGGAAPLAPEKIGTPILVPGMFVRIRLPISKEHPALLVIDKAISADQGKKYVYVVAKDKTGDTTIVAKKIVTTGALQDDGLRVIESGLDAGDLVLTGGLQQVRPGMVFQPEIVDPMPTTSGPARTQLPGAGAKTKAGAGKKSKS
jgi:multidrug efflux system membrane fusion protein